MVVLSHFQATKLLSARGKGLPSLSISLNLGISQDNIFPLDIGVKTPDGQIISWEDIERINKSTTGCFLIEENRIEKIQIYSEKTGLLYSLMPTESAPTMLISGIPMHRIKGTNPLMDTISKVSNLKPVIGKVLDTATGLGYTSIRCAKSAELVVTIELDPAALDIARLNPWSQDLFRKPNIQQIIGNSFEEISHFQDGTFHRILHDPPTIQLAGELYSLTFYTQLWRVLRPGGKLFHYIGDLNSKSGRSVAAGASRRLRAASFTRIHPRPHSFGLLAYK